MDFGCGTLDIGSRGLRGYHFAYCHGLVVLHLWGHVGERKYRSLEALSLGEAPDDMATSSLDCDVPRREGSSTLTSPQRGK